ncbi:unnamed protein product [Arabidopsis thaliana]|uniref:(thale cress) hypothetical protein n=1 Tax=Arabidopsis thaliana TaxID=3702 RepID=A0A654EZI3_ARATH|nr:unnamed protein product [Arabidopsis thaliana]VYS54693.1 unnamed protein product [Arabidopsis thaliana]
MSQEPFETSCSFVSPMNRDKEAFNSRHGPFSKNQNYFESNDITMNTENLLNPFHFGGGSCGCAFLSTESMLCSFTVSGEEHGTNNSDTLGDPSNISLRCFGSIESILKVARDGIEITMMPIPRLVNNAPQWTIKKRLTEHNVNPTYGQLRLPRSFFEQQIRGHLPEADLQKRTHC